MPVQNRSAHGSAHSTNRVRPGLQIRVLIALFPLVTLAAASAARAEVLVTTSGERVETRGPWRVAGRQVIFTSTGGTLSALRLSEVDLEASEQASRGTERPAPSPPLTEAPPRARPEPVLTVTDADIKRGTAPAGGPAEVLMRRLRSALAYDDVDAAMRLVLLEDVPSRMQMSIRHIFDEAIKRRVKDIIFEPAAEDAAGPTVPATVPATVLDGVTYRPNTKVVGRMRVELEPSVEEGDADVMEFSFFVGESLGSYVIVAPKAVSAAPVDAGEEAPANTPARSGGEPAAGGASR